jgi:predicted ribosomally synthesized peptide with nif11-like leader
MTQQISEFMALAAADASVTAQLQTATSAADVVRIARSRGLDISESDVEEAFQPAETPIAEAELAGVVGGMVEARFSCYCGYNHNETLIS